MPVLNLNGKRFGRLIVCGRAENDRHGRARWAWRCDCGREGFARSQDLLRGRSASCGCLRRELTAVKRLSHGETRSRKWTPEYRAHNGMLRRCYEEGHISFPRYGGRGIAVCDRWRLGENGKTGFECFLTDVGRRPSSSHSLDRWPDNDGNYDPDNVRWALPAEQSENSRRPCRVVYRGQRVTIRQALEMVGNAVPVPTVRTRMARGWSIAKSIEAKL